MGRPTIRDLAQAAGLSVATVNRVLSGAANVRQPTRQQVQDAATRIGFYGLGAIQSRVAAALPRLRFGFLLLQPHRPFYQNTARAIRAANSAVTDAEIEVQIEFLEDLSPQNTATRALALAQTCDAISITSAVHPQVLQAIEQIQGTGKPVFGFISQLSPSGQVHYVGLDNWKVGRTAAWAVMMMCKAPGKIGILMGNPRFRNQEMNEAGFRSYFREFGRDFTLLEPVPTFEAAAVAQEITEKLVRDHPDLAALYVAGGSITGVLAALQGFRRREEMVVVGYELMDVTRAALLDGTMTLAIAHPLDRMAKALLLAMTGACLSAATGRSWTSVVPFEIFTRENI